MIMQSDHRFVDYGGPPEDHAGTAVVQSPNAPQTQTMRDYDDLFDDDASDEDYNQTHAVAPLRLHTAHTLRSPDQGSSPLIAQTRPDEEALFEDDEDSYSEASRMTTPRSARQDPVATRSPRLARTPVSARNRQLSEVLFEHDEQSPDAGAPVTLMAAPGQAMEVPESNESNIVQHVRPQHDESRAASHQSPSSGRVIRADSLQPTHKSPDLSDSDDDSDLSLHDLHNRPSSPTALTPIAGPSSSLLPTSAHKHSRRPSFELYTPSESHLVRRKLDTHLVLFLALLYALSFLDRSNIGNASLAGLRSDLRMTDGQFTLLLRGFYATYVLFEWMTLLYRLIPAHIYISLCVAAWGLIASLQAVTTSFSGLLVLRLLLGVAEAAFGPGVPFYLSFFFRREELASRVGMFIAAAPLASCFASGLAYGIVKVGDRLPIASWRVLFLVEGFPSVLVAVWAWRWVPDGPGSAKWLGDRERRVAVLRLRNGEEGTEKGDGGGDGGMGRKSGVDWREVKAALKDPKSYLTASLFFCCNVAFSSMPVFEPTIVKSMGYNPTTAQGLSALPHLCAFITVLLISRLSDRYRIRSLFIAFVGLCSMVGYIFLAAASSIDLSPAIKYLCLFPITSGFFTAVTLTIVWTLDNQKGESGKGAGVALLNIIGQMGPLVGTGLYPRSEGPDYVRGHVVCACAMSAVVGLSLGLRWWLRRLNSRRGQGYQAVGDGDFEMKNADDGEIEDGPDRTGRSKEEDFVYIL